MSDLDIPALHEFLTRALYYLNKLGSNLQKRTQNLIDNKINVEYLDSVDNITKVGKKISTICLLSKQSIDTVETTVSSRLKLFTNDSSRAKTKPPDEVDSMIESPNLTAPLTSESKTSLDPDDKDSINNRSMTIPEDIDFKHFLKCRVILSPFTKETVLVKNIENKKTRDSCFKTDEKRTQCSNSKNVTTGNEDPKIMKGWSPSFSITADRRRKASNKRRRIICPIISSDSSDAEQNDDINNILQPPVIINNSSVTPKDECHKPTLVKSQENNLDFPDSAEYKASDTPSVNGTDERINVTENLSNTSIKFPFSGNDQTSVDSDAIEASELVKNIEPDILDQSNKLPDQSETALINTLKIESTSERPIDHPIHVKIHATGESMTKTTSSEITSHEEAEPQIMNAEISSKTVDSKLKKNIISSSDENNSIDNSTFLNLNNDQDKNLIKSPNKANVTCDSSNLDEKGTTEPDEKSVTELASLPPACKPLLKCVSINRLLAPSCGDGILSDTNKPFPKIVSFNDTPITIIFPEVSTVPSVIPNVIGCSPKPAIKSTNYSYKPIPEKGTKKKQSRLNKKLTKETAEHTALLEKIRTDITVGNIVSDVRVERLSLDNLTEILEKFNLDIIHNESGKMIAISKKLNEVPKRALLNSSDLTSGSCNDDIVSDCESRSLEKLSKKKKKFCKKRRKKNPFDDVDSDDDESAKASKRKKKRCSQERVEEFGDGRDDDSSESDEMGRSLRLKGRGESSTADKDSNNRTKTDSEPSEKTNSKSTEKSSKTEETLLDVMTNGTNKDLDDQESDDETSSGLDAESNPKVKKMSVSFSEKPTKMNRIKSDLLEDSTSSNRDSPPKLNGKSKPKTPVVDEITIIDSDDEDPKDINESAKMEEDAESDSEASTKKRLKKITTVSLKSESESENSDGDKPKKKNNNGKARDDQSAKSEDEGSDIDRKKKPNGETDSDESEIFQPARRKRKPNKTSSAGESSAGSGNEGQSQAQKRKRIKRASDEESSGEGDSSGSEGGRRGRKNIRAVKRSGKLDEATRNAARQERERVQRITERQKLYNESMFDESGRPDEVVKLDKVVLDFDPETKEPTISVDRGLVYKLKPHQGNGIKFMWDACFESVKEIKNTKGSGCILAHCMGLGKTLQVVTLVHTLLLNKALTKVERVLVVCPLSTVLNWVNEFTMWLEHAHSEDEVNIYELSRFKQNYERANQLKDWLDCGGVCVLGYEMFRNLSADNNKKFKKAQLATFQKALVDPGPDLVVCDEGHLLKNEKTSLSQSMNKVKTLRRIVLTGTPLQNNLKEYYCMVQFVKPNLLGKYNEYLNRFVNPITNGQYTDSTEQDIRVMKRRSHVLHKMLDGAVQRRDYAVLAPFLPPKHEYVLFISLTEIQIKLYSFYLENFSRRSHPDRKNTGYLFPDFQALQRIWTHPLVLKANSARYELMQQKKKDKEEEDEDSEGSLVDFIDDEDSTTTPDTSESDMSDDEDDGRRKKKKKKGKQTHKAVHKRLTRANANTVDDDDDVIETKPEEIVAARLENPTEWWISLCSEEELDDVRHSNKLLLLLDILKQCDAIGDKLLVFSQSLYSLDLIEQFLAKIDDATQSDQKDDALGGHIGSWSQGLDYFRLDGSTSCENRAIWCKSFNREDNPRARLFLISTRAGGLGINLVAANRVVIFDMSWNPSHDVQSIFRVYRFGQKKPCYVYRFLALGTMEEKIYERQVTKQAISKRVIDEQQIDRHYAESDLAELYTFCPVPEGAREVPKLPRDRLFADLLRQHDTVIYKYHEHDSLLENKEEETLTEEERKAAWDDYENEKTRPPPAVFGGSFLANFQQQQQQQIAINALTSVLRQDYPGISDQNLASMIPLLLQQMHQSGDAPLMQKMMAAQNMISGYKYPQNNMLLNPANIAAANMAAGNRQNAPSYQYSWQQQQQMQLQRLQQQQAMQANMNMKYYAGGLGSRDSMDMAALQQRQRALLLGAAGNSAAGAPLALPRGRPKHQQPLSAGEVVDLDSE